MQRGPPGGGRTAPGGGGGSAEPLLAHAAGDRPEDWEAPPCTGEQDALEDCGDVSVRREVWLFFNASVSEVGICRYSKRYEMFSISLVVALVVLDATASVEEFSWLEATSEVLWCRDAAYAVFAAEYLLRLWSCVESSAYGDHPILSRLRWAREFLPVVDFIVLLAFLLGLLQIHAARGLQALRMVRLLRLLTLFRVDRSTNSFSIIFDVFQKKRHELTASLASALVIMIMAGTLMYYAENAAQPEKFSSIPASMWWSVAALTTVGYGDLVPETAEGKLLGAVVAIFGIALFALPAGILGSAYAEIQEERQLLAQEGVGRQRSPSLGGEPSLPAPGLSAADAGACAAARGRRCSAPALLRSDASGALGADAAAAGPAPLVAATLQALQATFEGLRVGQGELREGLEQLAAQQEEMLRLQGELLAEQRDARRRHAELAARLGGDAQSPAPAAD